MESAHHKKTQILITDVGSFLGVGLARLFLSQNCTVFGVGKSNLASDLLHKRDFTLLELNLTQPLPAYLPAFDKIFHLISKPPLFSKSAKSSQTEDFLPAITSVIFQAKEADSQLSLIVPLASDSNFYDYVTDDLAKKNIRIFLTHNSINYRANNNNRSNKVFPAHFFI